VCVGVFVGVVGCVCWLCMGLVVGWCGWCVGVCLCVGWELLFLWLRLVRLLGVWLLVCVCVCVCGCVCVCVCVCVRACIIIKKEKEHYGHKPHPLLCVIV